MVARGPLGPRFIGRFDRIQTRCASLRLAGYGDHAALHRHGDRRDAQRNGNNVFEVVLDGKHTVLTLQSGTKKYTLGSGLAAGRA